jgi:tetratricopeptide (TPR) repeat protein
VATSGRIDELRKRYEENQRRFFAPLANEYRKAGDLEQAIGLCRVHLAEVPQNLSGQIVFGQALYEAGSLDDARSAFETAIGLDPENLIALRQLGDIARLQSDVPRAKVWYQRVLDADRRNEDVLALMAELEAAEPAPAPAAHAALAPDDAPADEQVAESAATPPEQESESTQAPAVELQPMIEMGHQPPAESEPEVAHIDLEGHFPEPGALRPAPLVQPSLISMTPTVAMDVIPGPISVSEPTPLIVPAFDESLRRSDSPVKPEKSAFDVIEPVFPRTTPETVATVSDSAEPSAPEPEQFTPDSSFGFEIDLGAAATIPVVPPAPTADEFANFGAAAEASPAEDALELLTPEPEEPPISGFSEVAPPEIEQAAAMEFDASPPDQAPEPVEPISLDFDVPPTPPRRSTPAVIDSFDLIDSGRTPLSSDIIPESPAAPTVPPAIVYQLDSVEEIELTEFGDETATAEPDLAPESVVTSPDEISTEPPSEPAAAALHDEPTLAPAEDEPPTQSFQSFTAIHDMETPVVPIQPVEAFATETMAELYVRQGLRHEAIGVYRQLVAARPNDDALRARLAELEADGRTQPGPATARAFFAGLAGTRPTPRSVPSVAELAPPPETEGSVDALFGRASVAAHDERSARALADAFGDESDDRAAGGDRGIDRLFNPPAP